LGASRSFPNSLAIFFSAGVAEYFDIYIYIYINKSDLIQKLLNQIFTS
jgi:hypothetical protein